MIRLGHIDYSNCIPVHAQLLDAPPPDVRLVHGVPTALNRALAAGEIDAAPCSSIELPRHADAYRVLPLHAIGAAGAVHSILLESRLPLDQLDGRVIAVPDASATSVVLLRALLEVRLGIRPEYRWYTQGADGGAAGDDGAEADAGGGTPGASGPDAGAGWAAVLRIGDVALRHAARRQHTAHAAGCVVDLAAEWFDWTGLPFAFAVWQVRCDVDAERVRRLAALLASSRAWFGRNAESLAARYAPRFGLDAQQLFTYWRALRFDFDAPMQQGLLRFFALAAELGEAPPLERLPWAAT